MLNGWKAIGTYLQRDERTAMRWASERGLPVHRVPGPGRGSVYALEGEVDAWLEADREQPAPVPAAVAVIEPVEPPTVHLRPLRWWRRRWVGSALIGAGISLVVAGFLMLHLPARRLVPRDVGFADSTAKAMFLQASYDWNLRTPESLTRAIREYGNTIARDPRVPAAYVGLANSYLLLREYGSLPNAEAYARAEAAAQAAVALSPSCAEAHRALAFIDFWWRQDRADARREFERALALRPDDPLTHHWLANALLANGETEAALREIDRARDLDPGATSIVTDRAAILYFSGHRAEGLASLRLLAREQPGNVGAHRPLAEISLFEGRPDEFLRETAMTARLRDDRASMAQVERWRLDGAKAEAIEQAMLRDARRPTTDWFRVARVAALLGRHDEAVDALSRACGSHEPAAISASSDLWLSRAVPLSVIAQHCGRSASIL